MSDQPQNLKAQQHVWFYQKTTLLNVIDEGPFTDAEMLQHARDRNLALTTLVRSPTRTKNQWIHAQQVPSLAGAINEAIEAAAARKKQQADAKKMRRQKPESLVASDDAPNHVPETRVESPGDSALGMASPSETAIIPQNNSLPSQEDVDAATVDSTTPEMRSAPNHREPKYPHDIDRIKRLLFRISTFIAYVVAAIVLLGLVIRGFAFIFTFSESPPRLVSYADIKQELSAEDSADDSLNQSTDVTIAQSLATNGNEQYSILFGSKTPSAVKKYLANSGRRECQAIQELDEVLDEQRSLEVFLAQFNKFLLEMEKDSVVTEDEKSMLVFAFVNEQGRELKRAENRNESAIAASAQHWGRAFVLFQLLVLVSVALVLFTIERNTRPI